VIKKVLKLNDYYKVKYPNIKQFIDFAFVGFSTGILDFGFTFLIRDLFNYNEYLANTVGLTTAIITKYFLHRYWVFKAAADTNKAAEHKKFTKFIIVSVSGIGINNTVIYLLSFVGIAGTTWFYISKVFATGVVMIWNFFANKFWTFKKHE